MPELHVPVFHLHQAGRGCRLECIDLRGGAAKHGRRGEDLREVVHRVDCGDEQRVACFSRELGQPARERSLQAGSERERRCAY